MLGRDWSQKVQSVKSRSWRFPFGSWLVAEKPSEMPLTHWSIDRAGLHASRLGGEGRMTHSTHLQNRSQPVYIVYMETESGSARTVVEECHEWGGTRLSLGDFRIYRGSAAVVMRIELSLQHLIEMPMLAGRSAPPNVIA